MAIYAECPKCHRQMKTKRKRCEKCNEPMDKAKKARKVKYWVIYQVKGKQYRDPAGYSIEMAKAIEGKVQSLRKEGRLLDIKKDTHMTFKELSEWYLSLEKVKALSSYWRVDIALNRFNEVFGQIIVGQIKSVDLEDYQIRRKNEGVADGTVDHEVGAAKTAVRKAFDNDLVGGDTLKVFKRVKKLLKVNSNARDRVLSPSEFDGLIKNASRHLKDILITAYWTGMRKGEILTLRWNRVDMKERFIRLRPEDTKTGQPRTVPIGTALYDVLQGIPRGIPGDKHVFLWRKRPVTNIRGSLRDACAGAGIPYGRGTVNGFVFHDLRHTFNTNARKAGVQESVINAIVGHADNSMFSRYNHVDAEDLRLAMRKLEDYLSDLARPEKILKSSE